MLRARVSGVDPHDPEKASEEHRGDVDFRADVEVTTGDVIEGSGWRAEPQGGGVSLLNGPAYASVIRVPGFSRTRIQRARSIS